MGTPELHPEKYRSLLQRRGEPIRWWRSERCPNYNPEIGGHTGGDCAVCKGRGRVYVEQTITGYKVSVRNVHAHKEFLRSGVLLVDDVQITSMPDEVPMGEGDLVALMVRSHRISESAVRGATDSDRVHHAPVASVDRIWDATREYVAGTDFEIVNAWDTSSDQLIASVHWLDGGQAPAEGNTYTITYRFCSVYQILPDIGVQRRVIEGVSLPQLVFARMRNPEELRS